MFYSWLTSLWFLLFYSPKPYSQVWILIYRNWSIFQEYQFKGAVCLKALFFVDSRPFFLNNYNVARISSEIKKWLHVLSWRITVATRDEIITDYNTKAVSVDAYQRRDNNSDTAGKVKNETWQQMNNLFQRLCSVRSFLLSRKHQ